MADKTAIPSMQTSLAKYYISYMKNYYPKVYVVSSKYLLLRIAS